MKHREIKFRFWDSKTNIMLFESEDWSCGLNEAFEVMIRQYDLIPLQYTGLKDNKRTKEFPNGQEIYEGDILTWVRENREKTQKEIFKYIVVFEEGSFVCNHAFEEYGRWGFLSRAFDSDLQNLGKIEIIGNIYENSNLITQTK